MARSEASKQRQGDSGFLRDAGNEQKLPFTTAGQVFTGAWKRIDQFAGFSFLYGSNQPFTVRIEFSRDGKVRDFTASISPQVRGPLLGFYSVMSMQPRGTYFQPYYRIVVTNGLSPQAFVVTNAILGDHFPGYDISVDGPIPVLGLGKLGMNLIWGYGPYDPVTKSYLKIPVGLETDGAPVGTAAMLAKLGEVKSAILALPAPPTPPTTVDIGNVGDFPVPPAFPATFPLPTSQVTALTPPAPLPFPASYPLPSAQLTALTPPVFPAGFNVNNFPAIEPVSPLGALYHRRNTATALQVLKAGPGTLRKVIVGKYGSTTVLTLLDGTTVGAPVIALLSFSAAGSAFSPHALPLDIKFTTGLSIVQVGTNDLTVTYD